MKRHRSIRRYKSEAIPLEHVRLAVEAGQAASTSSAIQSYCVIHVTDGLKRKKLAELTGPQEQVRRAGAFFVVCGDTRRHRLLCAREGRAYEARMEAFLLAVIDATLFAQNMALALESQGYGVCYIGGLRSQLFEVERVLTPPEGVYPLFGMCAGVADESPMERPRLGAEAVLFENKYPDDESMLGMIEAYDERYARYIERREGAGRGWSGSMTKKFAEARRVDVGEYYRSKGADFS